MTEFTDEQGNPVEIENHPVREKRLDYNPGTRPMRPARYTGYIPAPRVYSALEGRMVPTGQELSQCPECGFWMSDKPSFQEEQEHERQCS